MLLYQNRINLCYLIVYKDILLKYYSCQGIDSRCWIQNIIFKILYVFVRQLESRWQMKREPDWNFQNEIDARDHHSHRYNLHLISTCILFADRHSQIWCQKIPRSKLWLLSNAWKERKKMDWKLWGVGGIFFPLIHKSVWKKRTKFIFVWEHYKSFYGPLEHTVFTLTSQHLIFRPHRKTH